MIMSDSRTHDLWLNDVGKLKQFVTASLEEYIYIYTCTVIALPRIQTFSTLSHRQAVKP